MTITEALNNRYNKDYLSYSSIKFALKDMAQFDRYMKGEMYKDSDALRFGSLYDMMLLEFDKCMDTYKLITHEEVMDNVSDKTRESKNPKMTKDYKSIVEKLRLEAEKEGKIICSVDDWNTSKDMVERLDKSGLRKYLTGRVQEKVETTINGVKFMGYIDCLGKGFVTDSKSTRSVDGFRYDVKKFSYHLQAYIYTQATGIDTFYWVAQEKTYPYLPALVTCTEETLWSAELTIMDSLVKLERFLLGNDDLYSDYVSYKV
ncbi:MAG: PD-(D/E)XK nuclease-like domain-containing protein [Opitutae bacterium]